MRTIEVAISKAGPRGADLVFDVESGLIVGLWDGANELKLEESAEVIHYWVDLVGKEKILAGAADKRFSAELDGDDADRDGDEELECLHSELECNVCNDCGEIIEWGDR